MFRQVLTSSTQPQIWSNDVVVRTRTAKKCTKMQNARARRAQLLFLLIKLNPLFCGVLVAVAVVRRRRCSLLFC